MTGVSWIGLTVAGPDVVEDQVLAEGARAIEVAISAGPWRDVLSGRVAVVQARPGALSVAVEMEAHRSDPRGYFEAPAVRAMLAGLCRLVQQAMQGAGWRCELPEVAPVVAAPGWRVVGAEPELFRARLIFASGSDPTEVG